MKKCPVCGNENNDTDLFCASCGARLSNKKFCKYCGAELEANDLFCPVCGKPTGAQENDASADDSNVKPFETETESTPEPEDTEYRESHFDTGYPGSRQLHYETEDADSNHDSRGNSYEGRVQKKRSHMPVIIAAIAGVAVVCLVLVNMIPSHNDSDAETAAVSGVSMSESVSGSSANGLLGDSISGSSESIDSVSISDDADQASEKANPLLPTASDIEQNNTQQTDTGKDSTANNSDDQSSNTSASDHSSNHNDSGSASDKSSNNGSTSSASDKKENNNTADSVAKVTDEDIESASATTVLYEKGHDHSPKNVLDGDASTAWSEGADGQGLGESLTLTLKGERLVSGMEIRSGYQKSDDLFQKNSRPSELEVSFSDGTSETVQLKDQTGWQTVTFAQSHKTSSVTLTIRSVYKGWKYEDTLITDIRLN